MNVVIEYVAASLLIVIILLAAYQMIATLPPTLERVRAEQLYTVAERLINKILLTPGHPPEWGNCPGEEIVVDPLLICRDIRSFGLALLSRRRITAHWIDAAPTTIPYVIDARKVMRLVRLPSLSNPFLVDVREIARLLAIEREYGFKLSIKRMVEHRLEGMSGSPFPTTFNVGVVNWQDMGLPYARVSGTYVVAVIRPQVGPPILVAIEVLAASCRTDTLGYCTLTFNASKILGKYGMGVRYVPFLVLRTVWNDYVAVDGFAMTHVEDNTGINVTWAEGYNFGNFIVLPKELMKSEELHVVKVVPLYNLVLNVTDVEWCRAEDGNTGQSGPGNEIPPWCYISPGPPMPGNIFEMYFFGRLKRVDWMSSHVIVFARRGNAWTVVVIDRLPEVELVTARAWPPNAVTATRIVYIYDYPYVVQLTVWRLVEGGWP